MDQSLKRFVVLLHEVPSGSKRGTHVDLMLESREALLTWAIESWPRQSTTLEALRLVDHRIEYLQYEGEVSGGRGFVSRIAEGVYSVKHDDEAVTIVLLKLVEGDTPLAEAKLTIPKLAVDQKGQIHFDFSGGKSSGCPPL